MSQYVIGIAGTYEPATYNETDQSVNPSTVAVAVTVIPEISWPLFHAAFGRDDLTGMWWYAPAEEAIPVIEEAIEQFNTRRIEFAALLDPEDWRGVQGNRRVLQRLLEDLKKYPDNVISWGRE